MSELVGTPAQVAEALECSEDNVLWLKKNAGLPYVMVGRAMWRVPWFALNEWLASEVARNALAGMADKDGDKKTGPTRLTGT